jgi:hypothetical protein
VKLSPDSVGPESVAFRRALERTCRVGLDLSLLPIGPVILAVAKSFCISCESDCRVGRGLLIVLHESRDLRMCKRLNEAHGPC